MSIVTSPGLVGWAQFPFDFIAARNFPQPPSSETRSLCYSPQRNGHKQRITHHNRTPGVHITNYTTHFAPTSSFFQSCNHNMVFISSDSMAQRMFVFRWIYMWERRKGCATKSRFHPRDDFISGAKWGGKTRNFSGAHIRVVQLQCENFSSRRKEIGNCMKYMWVRGRLRILELHFNNILGGGACWVEFGGFVQTKRSRRVEWVYVVYCVHFDVSCKTLIFIVGRPSLSSVCAQGKLDFWAVWTAVAGVWGCGQKLL